MANIKMTDGHYVDDRYVAYKGSDKKMHALRDFEWPVFEKSSGSAGAKNFVDMTVTWPIAFSRKPVVLAQIISSSLSGGNVGLLQIGVRQDLVTTTQAVIRVFNCHPSSASNVEVGVLAINPDQPAECTIQRVKLTDSVLVDGSGVWMEKPSKTLDQCPDLKFSITNDTTSVNLSTTNWTAQSGKQLTAPNVGYLNTPVVGFVTSYVTTNPNTVNGVSGTILQNGSSAAGVAGNYILSGLSRGSSASGTATPFTRKVLWVGV